MLTLNIPATEYYDPKIEQFVYTDEVKLQLEHSLVAISKWESKWLKPFLSKNDYKADEIYDYIRCMVVGDDNISDCIINSLTEDQMNTITKYIKCPNTATTISKTGGSPNREVITSELIYYWMIANSIPFECQYWHINRLMTLINICGIKNNPPKKMKVGEVMSRNRAINEARKKAMKTSG